MQSLIEEEWASRACLEFSSEKAGSSAEMSTRRGKASVDRSKGVHSNSGYWTDNLEDIS